VAANAELSVRFLQHSIRSGHQVPHSHAVVRVPYEGISMTNLEFGTRVLCNVVRHFCA
jgi:hypothetical protein